MLWLQILNSNVVIYLRVHFSVEDNGFGFHFSVNLVSGKNDGDILTNAN